VHERRFAHSSSRTSAPREGEGLGFYELLTPAGEDYLHARAADLKRQAKRIEEFATRYETWTKRAARRTRKSGGTKRPEGGP
jgi:hypothetical protein